MTIGSSFKFHKILVPSDTYIVKIFCDSKTIIDDTLIYSNYIPILLRYFSCVDQVFTKHRLSLKLNKYNFFLSRIEYIRHDLTVDDNCPAQFKFEFIKQWSLLQHGLSLLSIIGMCSFYNNYVP